MQYWRPENEQLVKEALREAGRTELLGTGKAALVEEYKRMGWRPPSNKGKSHGRPKRA